MRPGRLNQSWPKERVGIANPNLISVDELRKSTSFNKSKHTHKSECNFCGRSHARRSCPAYGRECYKCGGKNHFSNMCGSLRSSNSESKHDSRRPRQANEKKCTRCKCRVHEISKCQNDMDDLSKQVQSLFYS